MLLILLGLFLLHIKLNDSNRAYDSLPDYDYIGEIKELAAQKRWGEAKVLCEDVIKSELPCAGEARLLMEQYNKESGIVFNRAYKACRAFITGKPDSSIEELAGSIVADMIIYGDLRDIFLQGWYKISGKENDPVIAALAAAGLITEFADMADWAPALLKVLRKSGAMTAELSEKLLKMLRETISRKKIDPAAGKFFRDSRTLAENCGFIRTGNIFKHIKSPADLAVMAQFSKHSPHLAALSAKHCRNDMVRVIQTAGKHPHGMMLLKHIARKGKLLTRSGKILYKGYWEQFLLQNTGNFLYLICALFSAAGVFLIFCGIKKRR